MDKGKEKLSMVLGAWEIAFKQFVLDDECDREEAAKELEVAVKNLAEAQTQYLKQR